MYFFGDNLEASGAGVARKVKDQINAFTASGLKCNLCVLPFYSHNNKLIAKCLRRLPFINLQLLSFGLEESDLAMLDAPSKDDLQRLDPMYLSYFLPWNSVRNYEFAKSRGFKDLTHEWTRTHHAENFDQVDSRAYLVHPWLKYPKFGHASATDYTARFIRYGLMTRDEAIKIIKEKDHALDPKCVDDFCEFCGYSRAEFYAIVDKLYNKDLFEKDEFGRWVLKEAIYNK